MFKLRSILEVDFFKLMYLFENSKVYLKKTLKTYAFMFKFENIQKVDF